MDNLNIRALMLRNYILRRVAGSTGLPEEIIYGQSRRLEAVTARKIFFCALRFAGLSTVEIGHCLGRNPSAIDRATREALPRIKEWASGICLQAGIPPRDFSEAAPDRRRRIRSRFRKVPNYKNNTIEVVEVWV